MTSKVEEVARAIRDNIQAALPAGVSVDYQYAARAAMTAMRNPTIEMMRAAREHHEGEHYLPHSLFNSMLDAALSEEAT